MATLTEDYVAMPAVYHTHVQRSEHGGDGAGRVVVVAATSREVVGALDLVPTLVCGVGPQNARKALEKLLASKRPDAVLHVGIAGARRGSGIPVLATVIGSESIDCDLETPPIDPDAQLFEIARTSLQGAVVASIGTSARVGGTRHTPVEAMEGHAVLSVCAAAGVRAIEVRVISNEIEETDRSRWLFNDAFAELERVTRALLAKL